MQSTPNRYDRKDYESNPRGRSRQESTPGKQRSSNGAGGGRSAGARSMPRAASPARDGPLASSAHGGSLRWGVVNADGNVGSPRVGRGGGGFSANWFHNNPDGPGGVRSSKLSSHMSGMQPVIDNIGGPSGPVEHSGMVVPTELPSQAIAGGQTTRDLGQTMSRTNMAAEGGTKPFTEEVVSYKHGGNIILHQWAESGHLLVNCQSPTPQSFICQYGISKGKMAWTLDVSRTCDKFWFGVTTDKDLDCNGWVADYDAAYMVSEEGEIVESTYDNYVPRTLQDRPGRPAMVHQADAAPRWVRLKRFGPAADIHGIWASVAFLLDMDKGELRMQVRAEMSAKPTGSQDF